MVSNFIGSFLSHYSGSLAWLYTTTVVWKCQHYSGSLSINYKTCGKLVKNFYIVKFKIYIDKDILRIYNRNIFKVLWKRKFQGKIPKTMEKLNMEQRGYFYVDLLILNTVS